VNIPKALEWRRVNNFAFAGINFDKCVNRVAKLMHVFGHNALLRYAELIRSSSASQFFRLFFAIVKRKS